MPISNHSNPSHSQLQSKFSLEASFEPLTVTDHEALARSWITPKMAQEAGIVRVNSLVGAEIVGRNGNADFSGLVFPYRMPWEPDKAVLHVLRLDRPEVEIKHGKPREKKYLVAWE